MRIHFIAIGGSAMHNLALALHDYGHHVTGSDDEIYEPSRTRLLSAGLLPSQYGWYKNKIEPSIDAVILGMHARVDNPELLAAQKLGLKIYSYPEFVASQSVNKTRIVVAGSHGKTTTTSIIMHAMSYAGIDYDYLVGAQLEGFDRMVRLSDAKIIVLEGDEYLSSPIDRRPKMMHYDPDIAVITGVAWDHINVFPTLDDYVRQFRLFVQEMDSESTLYYYASDTHMNDLIAEAKHNCVVQPYDQISLDAERCMTVSDKKYPVRLIGNHNLQNILAAELVCVQVGVSRSTFYDSLATFTGANRRLQLLHSANDNHGDIYLDFAHAPSKVKATAQAVKDWYPQRKLIAVFELHTYSSLNAEFLPQYVDALSAADQAIVIYSEHALKMKKMPDLNAAFVQSCFAHDNLTVVTSAGDLRNAIDRSLNKDAQLLLMSSGRFDGMDLDFD